MSSSFSVFSNARRIFNAGWPRFAATALGCAALAGFSLYRFSLLHSLLSTPRPGEMGAAFAEIFLAIVPLVVCLLFLLRASARREHSKLTHGYNLRIDTLQKRLNAQEDLLSLIADHDNESIAIFDAKNQYWYVNATAAQEISREVKDVIGQPLESIIGYERALKMKERISRVRLSGKETEFVDPKMLQDGTPRFVRSRFQKVVYSDVPDGIMVREGDITNLLVARERRENSLRQIIATLVAVVDRRDPFAAGHSARVGRLSRVLAEEMVLGEQDIETAEIAGSLMNFGKVLVPRSILTKTSALTPEELRQVRESILTSADILSLIDFSGNVVPTLRQVLERYDGTGVPNRLKQDAILITARIVSVANAFVALVSPRAHRPSLDTDSAMQALMRDADRQYDRKVIDILAKCVKNKGRQLSWLIPEAPVA